MRCEIAGSQILDSLFLAFVGESTQGFACALVFVVKNTQRGFVNHGQTQRPTHLCDGDFFAVKKEVLVQIAARLEEPARKDDERTVRGVDEFAFGIVV